MVAPITAASKLPEGLVLASDVQPQAQEWLWPGFLPRGEIVLLEGDPDVGKTLLALDFAARVSTGRALPDGTKPDQARAETVLYLSAEDSPSKTLRPRLEAAGADLSRILLPMDGGDLLIPRDLGRLEALVAQRGIKLIIFDALNNYLAPDVNANRDQEVRRALQPLRELAEHRDLVVVGLRHFNKKQDTRALYRGAGSIALLAVARSVLAVARHPEDPELRVVLVQKGNLAPDDVKHPVGFKVAEDEESKQPQITWTRADEVPEIAAEELLTRPSGRRGPAPVVAGAAENFLREALRAPRTRKDVLALGAVIGLNAKALQRAFQNLNGTSTPSGKERIWIVPGITATGASA